MADRTPEPYPVAQMVEDYVRSELADAAQYSNRATLDESGIWSLHAVAARIYALGWRDGAHVGEEAARRAAERQADRQKDTTP